MAISTGEDHQSVASYNRLEESEYRVYPMRWFVLLVVCILNISNAMMWLMFSPVADKAAVFYSIDASQLNWFSVVFMVCSIPIGLIATGVIDTYGLRFGILLGSWLNVIGSVGRVVGSLDVLDDSYRFPVTMAGTVVAACAQPFIMFLPTKTAALWFKEDQRAVANTIGSMSNPLGIMLANVLAPVIVNAPRDMQLVNFVFLAPAAVGVLTATFGVCHSEPPTPPSRSAGEVSEPFIQGLKQIARNKAFWVLFLCLGTGVGLFSTLTTLLEQVVCARGYSDTFAGLCGGLLIVCGIIGAGIAGAIVDKTKKFEEVAKVSLGVAVLAGVALGQLAIKRDYEVALGIACALFGFFGFAVYPIGLELGVEATYPTAEATSAGLLIISGQIQGIIFVILMQALAQPLPTYDLQYETCSPRGNESSFITTTPSAGQVEALDMTVPLLFFVGVASLSFIVFATLFRTPYRRLQAERAAVTESILQYSTNRAAAVSS